VNSLYSYVPEAKFEGLKLGLSFGRTSKAMVARTGFTFTHGDNVVAEAWLYLPASSKGRVTVMDFESSEKMGNPGIRFQIQENAVIFNRDKIKIKPHTYEALVDIPYDEWYLMRVELTLGDEDNGQVRLYINDEVAMDERGATISQDIKSYDTFQVGLTARTDDPYSMWTDDVSVYVEKSKL
jgi:hypothetical protein